MTLSCGLSYSQPLAKQLEKHYQAFSEIENLNATVVTKTFQDVNSNSNPAVQEYSIRKKGKNFHYEMDDIEVWFGDQSMVLVDKEEELVRIKSIDKDEWESMLAGGVGIPKFDSIVDASGHAIIGPEESGDLRKYEISSDGEIISRTELYFDKESDFIRRIRYYYDSRFVKEFNVVEIEFTEFDIDPKPRFWVAERSHFYQKKSGKYLGGSKFPGFDVVVETAVGENN